MSYQRKTEDNRRLQKLYRATRGRLLSGAYYNRRKQRLMRFSPSDSGTHITKYYKRLANRKLRRRDFDEDAYAPQHSTYRREAEYRWLIY